VLLDLLFKQLLGGGVDWLLREGLDEQLADGHELVPNGVFNIVSQVVLLCLHIHLVFW